MLIGNHGVGPEFLSSRSHSCPGLPQMNTPGKNTEHPGTREDDPTCDPGGLLSSPSRCLSELQGDPGQVGK